MPRVVWTEKASEQLADIESADLVEQVLALASGLNRLPERGRRVPELEKRPEYNILREIILPHKARVIYLFVPDSDEVLILGILTKGRVFHLEVLGHRFNPE